MRREEERRDVQSDGEGVLFGFFDATDFGGALFCISGGLLCVPALSGGQQGTRLRKERRTR